VYGGEAVKQLRTGDLTIAHLACSVVGKAQTNFTEKATMSNIVCKNEFKSQSHKVGKGYLVDTQVSFTLTEGKSSIDVSMM